METTSRLRFLLFPKDDRRLSARVESLGGAGEPRADQLEKKLREFYPQAVVRPRDPLGELDSTVETWYVFRDGRPNHGNEEEPN